MAFLAHDGVGEMGGVATWMGDLVPWLRGEGIDARVYGFTVKSGRTPLFDSLDAAEVPITRTEHAPATRSVGSRAAWIRDQLLRDGIHVLVPNYFMSGFLAASWLGADRPRTVAVLHSDDRLYRRLLAETAAGNPFFPADAVVGVSQQLEGMARAALNGQVPVAGIPYGVPPPSGIASSPGEELRVVYSGRLEQEQKRIIDTVKAVCEAIAQDPNLRVDFLGDGSKRAECEQIVRSHGVASAIRFLGRLSADEVRRLLPTYHIFLLLSEYEGLPVALLEAAAAGLVPVCARMRSGIGEVVEHEITGLLVDEPAEAVDALRRLRCDRLLWERCAGAVRERSARYQIDRCGAEWRALLGALAYQQVDALSAGRVSPGHVPAPIEEFSFDDYRQSLWRRVRRRLQGLRDGLGWS